MSYQENPIAQYHSQCGDYNHLEHFLHFLEPFSQNIGIFDYSVIDLLTIEVRPTG